MDRFHFYKLINDVVQELRIQYRWEALKKENKASILPKELHFQVSIVHDNASCN